MKQFQDYKKYRTMQCICNVPLSIILFCLCYAIVWVLFGKISFDEAIGWVMLGVIFLSPILIIPSLFVGKWIFSRVEKLRLCRNKKDILYSLWITFYIYLIIGFGCSLLISIKYIFSLLLVFVIPISICACFISLIFAHFLPTETLNTNENLSGSLKKD
ncbi:MAG: hypothetical protein IKI11_11050 [Neisseriaceae bacterium]|nr:hypothetical protein [Neisseriaceae bacterium]